MAASLHRNVCRVPVIFTDTVFPRHDPRGGCYEAQRRKTALLVGRAASLASGDWKFAFQSQGMSGGAWLGPTSKHDSELKEEGHRGGIVQPMGFSRPRGVLYDIDIVSNSSRRGKACVGRADSLNDSPLLTAHWLILGRFGSVYDGKVKDTGRRALSRVDGPPVASSGSHELTSMKRVAIIAADLRLRGFALEEPAGLASRCLTRLRSSSRFGGVLVTDGGRLLSRLVLIVSKRDLGLRFCVESASRTTDWLQ